MEILMPVPRKTTYPHRRGSRDSKLPRQAPLFGFPSCAAELLRSYMWLQSNYILPCLCVPLSTLVSPEQDRYLAPGLKNHLNLLKGGWLTALENEPSWVAEQDLLAFPGVGQPE